MPGIVLNPLCTSFHSPHINNMRLILLSFFTDENLRGHRFGHLFMVTQLLSTKPGFDSERSAFRMYALNQYATWPLSVLLLQPKMEKERLEKGQGINYISAKCLTLY